MELLVTLPGGDSVRGFFMVTLLVELAAVPAIKVKASPETHKELYNVQLVTHVLHILRRTGMRPSEETVVF